MKLRLKQTPPFSVDMSELTPEFCRSKSVAKIENHLLQTAGQKLKVAELFEVSLTESEEETLEITSACEKLDYIGSTMTRGTLLVSGNIGNYAAGKLSGGLIEVRGNVGDYCGHSMCAGQVIVRGNAGDYCGSALVENIHGMTGGEIFILGNAGHHCGNYLRRGLIAVRGDAGDCCGVRMTAGTLIVSGQCGNFCGHGMTRGTIILYQLPNEGLAKTFVMQNRYFETDFLTLLSNHLQKLDIGFEPLPLPKLAQRYIGDRALAGKGEILVLSS